MNLAKVKSFFSFPRIVINLVWYVHIPFKLYHFFITSPLLPVYPNARDLHIWEWWVRKGTNRGSTDICTDRQQNINTKPRSNSAPCDQPDTDTLSFLPNPHLLLLLHHPWPAPPSLPPVITLLACRSISWWGLVVWGGMTNILHSIQRVTNGNTKDGC